jgi:hypothetical protein
MTVVARDVSGGRPPHGGLHRPGEGVTRRRPRDPALASNSRWAVRTAPPACSPSGRHQRDAVSQAGESVQVEFRHPQKAAEGQHEFGRFLIAEQQQLPGRCGGIHVGDGDIDRAGDQKERHQKPGRRERPSQQQPRERPVGADQDIGLMQAGLEERQIMHTDFLLEVMALEIGRGVAKMKQPLAPAQFLQRHEEESQSQ